MAKNDGYVGRIPNSPTYKVQAPKQVKTNPTPKVQTGKDLRTGKGKK